MAGDKITEKIMKASKTSSKNSSETVESETKNVGFDIEIPKEIYIPSKKRQKFIDDLRLP